MLFKDFSQCRQCKHEHPPVPGKKRTCAAFPAGIPLELLRNHHKHTTSYPGDNGILFELKAGAELAPIRTYEERRRNLERNLEALSE